MSDVRREMLLINSLDPNARLHLSKYTGQWFVASGIEIGNGVTLTGIAEHRDTPEAAVLAFFDRLTTIPLDEYLVTRYRERREWHWNGAAFVETTRADLRRVER